MQPMPPEAEMLRPLNRRQIILATLGAAGIAAAILFVGVLPAEYAVDPTGLGRLTGIAAIWAPAERVLQPSASGAAPSSRSFATAFRSDVIDIPLAVSGDAEHRDEVEYKVHLKMGGSYIYSWTATGVTDPEEFYTEFHGHTLAKGGTMTVAYYRKATGVSDNGVLTAPFDGVHGWYFQNQSLSPVKVRLRIAGFYELIPAGQPGNEAGFTARPTP